jgi:hypothetical protein
LDKKAYSAIGVNGDGTAALSCLLAEAGAAEAERDFDVATMTSRRWASWST